MTDPAVMSKQAADPVPAGAGGDMERRVTRLLHRMGVPAHLSGYRYLRSAILLSLDDTRGGAAPSAMGYLYPAVAAIWQTTRPAWSAPCATPSCWRGNAVT